MHLMNRTESGRCCKWVSWHQSANKQWKQSTQENPPSTNSIIFHYFLPIVNDLHHTLTPRLSTSGWFFGRRDPRSPCGAGWIPSIDVQCCPRIKLIYLHWTLRSRNQTSMSRINYMYYISYYIILSFPPYFPTIPHDFHLLSIYFPLLSHLPLLGCQADGRPCNAAVLRIFSGQGLHLWCEAAMDDAQISGQILRWMGIHHGKDMKNKKNNLGILRCIWK